MYPVSFLYLISSILFILFLYVVFCNTKSFVLQNNIRNTIKDNGDNVKPFVRNAAKHPESKDMNLTELEEFLKNA